MRWTWRGEAPQPPLVQGDRIAVVAGRELFVLDPRGAVQQRIALAEHASVELLADEGPVVVDGNVVQQRDWNGALRWQVDAEQEIAAVQRSSFGELAVCTHERGYPPRGRLLVIDHAGVMRWSSDAHATLGYVFRAPELAFDDAGNVYSLVTGRLGDGVSGDDKLTGGCRGFDRDGLALWQAPLAVDHPQSIQGRDDGVVVVGIRRVRSYDTSGAQQWECELDDGAVHDVPSLGIHLVRSCSRLPMARVLDRREGGGGTVLHGTLDADDVFYFARVLWSPPRSDCLVALAADGGVRWQLPLPAADYQVPFPIIGPDETVLVAQGDALIAVG
ncbi:MAG TPA: hypothetical protein VG755_44905 [Nannocystaceae bacterium]|nr:hypothetical protein [Nannocystaceae bacterium]